MKKIMISLLFIPFLCFAPVHESIDFKKELYFWKLGHYESRNNWKSYNSIGALGQWQMMYLARVEGGYHIMAKDFQKNPEIWTKDKQRDAIERFTFLNKCRLSKYIDKCRLINAMDSSWNHVYNNDTVKVTEQGILFMAHLGGVNNVKKFFKHGINAKDMNGTSLIDYLKYGDYDLPNN